MAEMTAGPAGSSGVDWSLAGREARGLAVPMRDGARLATDIYLPPQGIPGAPYPAILHRTAYGKQEGSAVPVARQLADDGYAVIVQDVRGRHDSGGTWVPNRHEGVDGFDTVEWIAAQPWSNGRVGTIGGSYSGYCQWALARERPPHLRAMMSTAAAGRWMQEAPWDNGCLALVMIAWANLVDGRVMQSPELIDWPAVYRHLPLRSMDDRLGRKLALWQEWLDHPTLDEYWLSMRLDRDFARIDVPVLHVTGLYDADQPGALYFYAGMVGASPRRGQQFLLLGPWDHEGTWDPVQTFGGVDFGSEATVDMAAVRRNWFGHWLKGDDEPAPEPRVRIFVTGINQWRGVTRWPPPGAAAEILYLHSRGHANGLTGDGALSGRRPEGAEPADAYTYDPRDPVPSVVDERFYSAEQAATPLDRRFQQRRQDVLVYNTAPYSAAQTLAGQPRMQLWGRTDAADTDWFAALHDVAPDGVPMLLCSGRMRARYRQSLERPGRVQPGAPQEYAFELSAVSHAVLAGHRLRLTITSSDFPSWDRNPNTGQEIGSDADLRTARNEVLHGPGFASKLTLPLAPDLIEASAAVVPEG